MRRPLTEILRRTKTTARDVADALDIDTATLAHYDVPECPEIVATQVARAASGQSSKWPPYLRSDRPLSRIATDIRRMSLMRLAASIGISYRVLLNHNHSRCPPRYIAAAIGEGPLAPHNPKATMAPSPIAAVEAHQGADVAPVRRAIEEAGLSVSEVARRLGCPRPMLYIWIDRLDAPEAVQDAVIQACLGNPAVLPRIGPSTKRAKRCPICRERGEDCRCRP